MADARDTTSPTERGGGKRWSNSKLLRKGVVANESAPTTELEGLKPGSFRAVQWAILKPPEATSYTLTLYRLVEVVNQNGNVIAEEWVPDEGKTFTGLTTSVVRSQYIDGQKLAAVISSIVDGGGLAAGAGFSVIWTPTNREIVS